MALMISLLKAIVEQFCKSLIFQAAPAYSVQHDRTNSTGISRKIARACAALLKDASRPLGSSIRWVTLGRYPKSRYTKSSVRKAKLWSLSRMGIVALPTMTIPLSELSLTGMLQFPVFIPSPIGVELAEISTSLLRFLFSFSEDKKRRTISSRLSLWIAS